PANTTIFIPVSSPFCLDCSQMGSHNHPILMFHSLAQSAHEYNSQNGGVPRKERPGSFRGTAGSGGKTMSEEPAEQALRLSLQQRAGSGEHSGGIRPGDGLRHGSAAEAAG